MTLPQTILTALDLTGRLREALATGRLDTCADLLAERADAMAAFEAAHRAATGAEQSECQPILTQLSQADRALQEAAAGGMAAAGQALRANLGASPRFGGAYDTPPEQKSVDRKA